MRCHIKHPLSALFLPSQTQPNIPSSPRAGPGSHSPAQLLRSAPGAAPTTGGGLGGRILKCGEETGQETLLILWKMLLFPRKFSVMMNGNLHTAEGKIGLISPKNQSEGQEVFWGRVSSPSCTEQILLHSSPLSSWTLFTSKLLLQALNSGIKFSIPA